VSHLARGVKTQLLVQQDLISKVWKLAMQSTAKALWFTLQFCGTVATMLGARHAPLQTAWLMCLGVFVSFSISFMYGLPVLGHAPMTPRWNLALIKTFEVVGLGSFPFFWMTRHGCKHRWLGMEAGTYAVIILIINIAWTVQVEVATGTLASICGILRMIHVACLMFSVILRTTSQHKAGSKLLTSEHGLVAFHPVSTAWMIGYLCWNVLFVSALGAPERGIHNLQCILAMVIQGYANPNAGHVSWSSFFLQSRFLSLGGYTVIILLLECIPFFQDVAWSRAWGASDEQNAVLASAAVALLLLGDLSSACWNSFLVMISRRHFKLFKPM